VSIKLRVNNGYIQIPLAKWGVNICELLEKDDDIENKCPIEKDENIIISKSVDIPEVPRVSYVILVDAYTEDQDQITCMEADFAY
jgi:hypothetical protein